MLGCVRVSISARFIKDWALGLGIRRGSELG